MSGTGTSEGTSESKPVVSADDVIFPPFPEPTDEDFDEDVTDEEKAFYKDKFSDLNQIVSSRLHCTACDRHLGCSALNDSRMKVHPMLRTLICNTCHSFYNSGEFDKGEDGSELYCRWCGQGGQVYCCSDCVHVFCAKCIKRNLGWPKIKEIENTDDWKCFKCNPKCLWDLRAVCWALLRYCDLRNGLVCDTDDVELRKKYSKQISIDQTSCCKNRGRKSLKVDSAKKKEKEKTKEAENVAKNIISKMPPTIQVKKFASINLDDFKPKVEKKAQKRPVSPKNKTGSIKNPISIAPYSGVGPASKKIRDNSSDYLFEVEMKKKKIGRPLGSKNRNTTGVVQPGADLVPNLYSPMRFGADKKVINLTRVPRPRIISNNFNGFPSPALFNPMSMNHMNISANNLTSDNINLSLDSLTQGIDFATMQAMRNTNSTYKNDDDVLCTPDFPLEPLCEVTEDNDDDVECITPGPVVAPILNSPPPLTPVRNNNHQANNLPKGVIQMTENDVTVNALTGGLKFRVDPQTLSSNKMYRLPDGRIFAINANPNMPGGYSATIVSQNPDGSPKVTPRSETFAAKLSAVTSSPRATHSHQNTRKRKKSPKPKSRKQKTNRDDSREGDFKVPVEWFRYNMIDAVDALEYSLSRLHKLKRETTSAHLRTRTLDEMKYLHRTLEQLLTTSSKRFLEIRDTLNKEMKLFILNKNKERQDNSEEEEDDDVEILPNHDDGPIFIDENSLDSMNASESRNIDLTGAQSSEHNDSTENRSNVDVLQNNINNMDDDSTNSAILDEYVPDVEPNDANDNADVIENQENETEEPTNTSNNSCEATSSSDTKRTSLNGDDKTDNDERVENKTSDDLVETIEGSTEQKNSKESSNDIDETKKQTDDEETIDDDGIDEGLNERDILVTGDKAEQDSAKCPDPDMSEEMIETLLKDDNIDHASMEISDLQEAESILS